MLEKGGGMHRAAITFDFDAISLWMVRRMTTPGPISRGEFGAYAIPRILRALEQHGVTATFFIPGHTIETYPDECRHIRDAGHEIAVHGYAHELVSEMTPAEEAETTARALDVIDRVLGITPTGMRTPSWDFSPATTGILKSLGFSYDSSLMGQDYRPYYLREGDMLQPSGPYLFGTPIDVVELPVSWSLDDYPQVEYLKTSAGVQPGPKTPREMFESFFDDFDYMRRIDPEGFHMITLHPQVVGRGQRMLAFEEYLERLVAGNAQFVTCDAVAMDFRSAGSPAGADREQVPK